MWRFHPFCTEGMICNDSSTSIQTVDKKSTCLQIYSDCNGLTSLVAVLYAASTTWLRRRCEGGILGRLGSTTTLEPWMRCQDIRDWDGNVTLTLEPPMWCLKLLQSRQGFYRITLQGWCIGKTSLNNRLTYQYNTTAFTPAISYPNRYYKIMFIIFLNMPSPYMPTASCFMIL